MSTGTQGDDGFKLEGLVRGDYAVTFEFCEKYQPKTASQSVVIGMRSAMMSAPEAVAGPAVRVATGTIAGRFPHSPGRRDAGMPGRKNRQSVVVSS